MKNRNDEDVDEDEDHPFENRALSIAAMDGSKAIVGSAEVEEVGDSKLNLEVEPSLEYDDDGSSLENPFTDGRRDKNLDEDDVANEEVDNDTLPKFEGRIDEVENRVQTLEENKRSMSVMGLFGTLANERSLPVLFALSLVLMMAAFRFSSPLLAIAGAIIMLSTTIHGTS